jgi:hypothetical protein
MERNKHNRRAQKKATAANRYAMHIAANIERSSRKWISMEKLPKDRAGNLDS